jgi:hypothetical protein
MYKTGRIRTLFLYSSLTFEAITCFGCSLIQPSSGGDKTKELVTQVFLAKKTCVTRGIIKGIVCEDGLFYT